ncbi:MAG: nuclease-related domain-containing protein [Nitrososphaerota archaeon]|nr:NERD domain-containing protein [Candidatus Calditenuaceae archaeon]MDW8072809.1 nuclease-related domain-containing protein [Nitrososphaerota archaeon]
MKRSRPTSLTPLDVKVLKATLRLNTADVSLLSLETGLDEGVVAESLEKLDIHTQTLSQPGELVETALRWLKRGRAYEEVSKSLPWDLFELLVARILEEAGLDVFRNISVTLGRRRVQLDIVALKSSAIYVIECKRWIRSLTGALAEREAQKLKARADLLARALLKMFGRGDYIHLVVPILVSPYTSPAVTEAFITPLRTFFSLLSEHPSTLPTPPAIKLFLRGVVASTFLEHRKLHA